MKVAEHEVKREQHRLSKGGGGFKGLGRELARLKGVQGTKMGSV